MARMTIDYQALRDVAEAIKIAATPQKLLAFRMKVTPQVVLALLDERERNQQYIKRRDQENEDIALTVGRLRVELEAAEKRIAELEAEPVSQTYKLNKLSGNSPVIPDGLSTVCAEAYQVVGVMADALGVFGDAAVQKVLDNLSQQKLVHRDVLPFSLPVTPDGWISCSERMPVIGELNWRTSFPLLITCEIGVIPAYYGFVSVNGDRHYGFMESLKYGDDSGGHPQTNEYGLISNVTHWMPLPEPPSRMVNNAAS
ncbi:ead/Ea22-like family protein [Escherichia coli]|uniref:ead/Ea22-like family protein n=2 Tax=Escherichia coli TaxID=562 RepID=UPI003B428D8B